MIAIGGCAALVGPAGIGKSAIARVALADVPHAVGRGLSTLRRRPYSALEPIVRDRLSGDPLDVAELMLGHVDGVLLIEDLHWLHERSIAALQLLVGRLPMVVTTRATTDPVIAALLEHATVVPVHPLTDRQADVLSRQLHPSLDSAARTRLLASAGGTPLLIDRLVDATGDVSPTILDAIADRLRRLDPPTRRATELVALLGRPAEPALVPELTVIRTDLVTRLEDGRIDMSHAAIRAGVAALLDRETRCAIHRRLADRLDDAEGALHDLAAANYERAAARAQRAAQVTKHTVERAELLRVAADATDATGADARALRVMAAEGFVDAGRWRDAVHQGELVPDDGSLEASDALFHQARARWNEGEVAVARGLLTRAESTAAGRDAARAVRITVERAYLEVRDRTPGATERIAAAVDASVDYPSVHLRARSSHGAALLYDGHPDWERVLRAALDDAATEPEPELEATIAYHLISGLGFHGRIHEALTVCDRFIGHTSAFGLRRWTAHFQQAALMHRSMIDPAIGDILADADAHLAANLLFRNRFLVHMVKALALLDLGRFDDARAAIDTLADECSETPEQIVTVSAVRAELAWHVDDPDLAHAALAIGRPVADAYFGLHLLTERTAAYVLQRHGEPIEPHLPSTSMPTWWPALHELEGLGRLATGDSVGARTELRTAADHWEAMGIGRWAVRAGVLAAKVAADSGHRSAPSIRRHYLQLARAGGLIGTLRRLGQPIHPSLTLTEENVLREIARGDPTRVVAERLGIAPTTVNQHVDSARRKLGAATRLEAALMVAS